MSIQQGNETDTESEIPSAKNKTTDREFELHHSDDVSSDSASDNCHNEARETESDNSVNESSEFEFACSDNEFIDECQNPVHENNDKPLYNDAALTVSERLIATLNLALRHNITEVLLTDILSLIALHCEQQMQTEYIHVSKVLLRYASAIDSALPL